MTPTILQLALNAAHHCDMIASGALSLADLRESLRLAQSYLGEVERRSFHPTTNFTYGDKVLYVPDHAKDDDLHPDREHGAVSSTNDIFVFVKFDSTVEKYGWDGATSQGCYPWQLKKL